MIKPIPGTESAAALFRSRRAGSAAALDFALAELRGFCAARQLPPPPVLAELDAFWPCTLLLVAQPGGLRLRILDDGGVSCFEQDWMAAAPAR